VIKLLIDGEVLLSLLNINNIDRMELLKLMIFNSQSMKPRNKLTS